MKFINHENSRLLEAKKGGGFFLFFFGLPFLLPGLFVLAAPFLGIKDSNGNPMPLLFAILFGGIFTTVGAGLMFGRGGIKIDKRVGTIESWWGLLVPFKKTLHSIDDFKHILITKETRRSKNGSYTVYPVYLDPKNPGEKKRLKFEEPRDMMKSRKTAETVSKFIDYDIHDQSTGEEVIREAGTLDESLRDQAQRLGEQTEIPTPPAYAKSKIQPRGKTLEIDIPAPGFSAGLVIPIAVIGVFMSIPLFGMLLPMLRDGKEDMMTKMIFGGFIGFFFVLLPALMVLGMIIKAFLGRTFIMVRKSEVSVTSKGLLSKTKKISADDVEELFVGGTTNSVAGRNSIVIRSDEQTVSFGNHLSHEEAEYIAYLIKSVLIS